MQFARKYEAKKCVEEINLRAGGGKSKSGKWCGVIVQGAGATRIERGCRRVDIAEFVDLKHP